MIKLISFDLDDTLWDGQQAIIAAQQAMHDWITCYHPTVAENASSGRYLILRAEVASDHSSRDYDLTFIRKEVLRRLFAENAYSNSEAHTYSEKAFNVFFEKRNQVRYFDDALVTLKYLKSKYQIAALTNGNADMIATGLSPMIDYFYSAESVGAAKPDTKMFHALLNDAKIKPQECIHVGDHPQHDIFAAESLGIKTIWFNSKKKKWSEKFRPGREINKLVLLPQAIQTICGEK